MIQEITNAICRQLYNEFGDGYMIYGEAVEQDLQPPCFFVNLIGTDFTRQINDNFLLDTRFVIQYFPVNELKANSECQAVNLRLFTALDYIYPDFQDGFGRVPLRGGRVQSNIVDKLLNFEIAYSMFVKKQHIENKDFMEKLKNTITLGG